MSWDFGILNLLRRRDPLPGYVETMKEMKEMKEEYKKENILLHEKLADLDRRLNESLESERDCLLKVVQLRIDIRNIAEELMIVRDWQSRQP